MKKCLLKLVVLLCLASVPAVAQTVTGRVTNSADGSPLPGVSVLVKGTTAGTTTDTDGRYSINPGDPASAVLVFSFIGFASQEIPVAGKTSIDVGLAEDITQLNEVVVTALGIERETKSLTYSVQEVKGEQLTNVRDPNMMNALSGKVAGLTINRSSSGVGGSTRVLVRGAKSVTANNQPLYVIDGVPLNNFVGAQPGDVWGGRGDGGDVLSMINPNDVESMTVLKGASATALYGSMGNYGVILITTKKAKSGSTKIDFSSNYTAEKPMYMPDMQYQYNQTSAGNIYSWGTKATSPDHAKSFFRTGSTLINTLSLSGGNDVAQTFFSYSNTANSGIMPTNTLKQHTFNFRETAKFLENKLSVDASVMVATQSVHNRPVSGLYFNPLTGLYLFPRGLNFNDYKNNFEYTSTLRPPLELQNWWNLNYDLSQSGQDTQQNPYWILNRNGNDYKKDNIFSSVSLKYLLSSSLTLQSRGSLSRNYDSYDLRAYAGTQGTLADANGRYVYDKNVSTTLYGDLILNGGTDLSENIGLNFNIGASIVDERSDRLFMDSKGADLAYANIFTLSNIAVSSAMNLSQFASRRQRQSVFGTASLNLQEKVYLDLTARNDWSSTLAFTPSAKSGYFYYSAGLNTIITDLATLPSSVNFLKLRASYATVGNDVASYSTRPTNNLVAGVFTTTQVIPFDKLLQPEQTKALEAGLEARFLNDKLTVDFTWYKSNTTNQYFQFGGPLGAGGNTYFINLGNVQNSGIELTLGYDVLNDTNLKWKTGFVLTRNVSLITELPKQLGGEYPITGEGVNNYSLRIKEGGKFGDLYGKKFQRAADGSIYVDDTGRPIPAAGGLSYLGNTQANFSLGWNNTISINKVAISLLIDGRVGGSVMSITQAMLDEYGVSKETADARNGGGVDMKATKLSDESKWSGKLPAEQFYTAVGGRAGITENYIYDATNFRVRELSVGYSLPIKGKFAKDVRLSIVGRNLFFLYKKAPYDPELSASTNNGVQGVDVFSIPATRSVGLNLKWSF